MRLQSLVLCKFNWKYEHGQERIITGSDSISGEQLGVQYVVVYD